MLPFLFDFEKWWKELPNLLEYVKLYYNVMGGGGGGQIDISHDFYMQIMSFFVACSRLVQYNCIAAHNSDLKIHCCSRLTAFIAMSYGSNSNVIISSKVIV